MRQVYKGIYIGTNNDAFDHELLQTRNIEAVLNVSHDHQTTAHPNIVSFKAGLSGDPAFADINPVELAVALMDMIIEDYDAILVYSGTSMSRASFVITLWLNCFRGLPFEAAAKITGLMMVPWMAEYLDLTADTPTHNLRWEGLHQPPEVPENDGPA